MKKKQISALLLCLLMLGGMIPAAAFAEEGGGALPAGAFLYEKGTSSEVPFP